TTSRDDQESFEVKLCVGNAERPADNERLASFSVPLVARGPRGTVTAGVTFHVAADGTARIAVKEKGVDAPVVEDGLRLPVG
ncbi:MAG: Hsp70 family protein, partial [Gammaproteobacteria bacterium]|nr:Hsp70 family protein [Gammaproteobacteria bacterium]NIR81600.1 Hsp70 family protein [Gammaproteobacteria bacterium]NIU02717.1 Hsp70 family protein [Gammaproteobacteria bacterium]NIX83992.1 Hsp70 family protein [Gammaproteobacteria bacterium]